MFDAVDKAICCLLGLIIVFFISVFGYVLYARYIAYQRVESLREEIRVESLREDSGEVLEEYSDYIFETDAYGYPVN